MQQEPVAAFTEFRWDVQTGAFPARKTAVDMRQVEHEAFFPILTKASWLEPVS